MANGANRTSLNDLFKDGIVTPYSLGQFVQIIDQMQRMVDYACEGVKAQKKDILKLQIKIGSLAVILSVVATITTNIIVQVLIKQYLVR